MSRITQKGHSGPIELFDSSTDISLSTLTGSRFDSSDGREFVLVQNGAVALSAGKVIQQPAAQANSAGLSPATSSTTGYSASYPIAGTVGGTQIQVASGATAILANRFMGGYLNVVEGTGAGQTLKVKTNTAAATTAAFIVTLEDAFKVATSTDSRFTFTINPFGSLFGTDYTTDGVIVTPASTLTGAPIGVALYPIAASTATIAKFGLIQTKGPIAVYAGGSVAVGLDVGCPDDTAGQVLTYAVATLSRIGTTMVAAVDAKANMVNLQL